MLCTTIVANGYAITLGRALVPPFIDVAVAVAVAAVDLTREFPSKNEAGVRWSGEYTQ